MLASAQKRYTSPLVTLAVSDRFKMYRSESERHMRNVKATSDPELESITRCWNQFQPTVLQQWVLGRVLNVESYSDALALAQTLRPSSKAVECFSLALAELGPRNAREELVFSMKAGLFLSAMVNAGKDSDYVLHLRHLGIPISHLGYMNEKNLLIEVDAAYDFCIKMKCGKVVLKGNADRGVGDYMEGGEIHVDGIPGHNGTSVGGYGNAFHGKIYHNGKLIVDE